MSRPAVAGAWGAASGPRALRAVLVVAGGGFLLVYLLLVSHRLTYPFELNYIESATADQVSRVTAGLPLYVPPSPEYVPLVYTPLFFWVAGGAARLVGDAMVGARAVSAVSSLASMVCIAFVVRRRTAEWPAAMMAAGLFVASFGASGGWFDIARVDSLFLGLLLAALLANEVRSPGRGVVVGVLLACAVSTKQSAMLPAVGILAADFWYRGRARYTPATAFAVALSSSTWLLDRASGGWYTYYVVKIAAGQAQNWSMLWQFWIVDVGRWLAPGVACASFLWVAWGRRARGDGERAYLFSIVAALILTAWHGRLTAGGFPNVLMPACAALAVLAGLAVHEARSAFTRQPWGETGVLLVCAAQFLAFAYDPMRQIPSAADRRATEALVVRLRKSGGPVLIPSHTYLARAAGLGGAAHRAAVSDVLQADPAAADRKILGPLRAAVASGRYALVVLDRAEWFGDEVLRCYDRPTPAFERANEGWLVAGWATRPSLLYKRSPGSCESSADFLFTSAASPLDPLSPRRHRNAGAKLVAGREFDRRPMLFSTARQSLRLPAVEALRVDG